jgi:kynureninase
MSFVVPNPNKMVETRSDDLLRWRVEFPILDRTTYLISHSLGAMPRKAKEWLATYADLWATRGVRAWEEAWWDLPRETGDRIGRILGAPPDTVTTHPNVSTALSVLASCLEWKPPRNRIVLSAEDFPSVLYVWERERRRGADVVLVPSRDGLSVTEEDLLAAIDEKTAVVCLSLVFYKTARLLNARPLIEKARQVGAHFFLDAYQGVGAVPLDVRALGADAVVGGSVKWLCGGPGAAYLYVRPDLLPRLEPRITGWAAHARPFAFEPPPIEYASGSRRLANGTPPVPALYAARAGHEIVEAIGVANIRAKSVRQTEALRSRLAERGLRVVSDPDPARRGGSLTVEVPHGAAVVAALAERDVLADFRPGAGLRVSPHFYTKDEELDAFVEEVSRVLETKAWRSHEGKAALH